MFKKTLGLWMAFMMIFSLAACCLVQPDRRLHQAAAKAHLPMNPPPGVKRRNHRQQKLPKRKHPRMTEKRWSSTFPGLELQKKWLLTLRSRPALICWKLSLPIHTRMIIRKLEMLQEKNGIQTLVQLLQTCRIPLKNMIRFLSVIQSGGTQPR